MAARSHSSKAYGWILGALFAAAAGLACGDFSGGSTSGGGSTGPTVPLSGTASVASINAFGSTLHPVLRTNCFDCHDSESKEAELDLETLPFDLDDKAVFARWIRIHDRVRDGEMPPRGKKLETASVEEFLGAISEPMVAAHRDQAAAKGRATLRRLNRYEYENTLRDLGDCEDNLMLDDERNLSESENKAKDRLIAMCKRIAADYS